MQTLLQNCRGTIKYFSPNHTINLVYGDRRGGLLSISLPEVLKLAESSINAKFFLLKFGYSVMGF